MSINDVAPDILARLAQPFFAQGCARVYAAACCGRVVVAPVQPRQCGSCSKPPQVQEFPRPA